MPSPAPSPAEIPIEIPVETLNQFLLSPLVTLQRDRMLAPLPASPPIPLLILLVVSLLAKIPAEILVETLCQFPLSPLATC